MDETKSDAAKAPDWPPVKEDELRALWALTDPPLSLAQIGQRMGVSKAAVRGKSRRMGLPDRSPRSQKGEAPLAPPVPHPDEWPAEKDARFRLLWTQTDPYLSNVEIGQRMGVSKDMVARKARRLGLSLRRTGLSGQPPRAVPSAPPRDDWPPEKEDELRALWGQTDPYLSMAEIGRRMGVSKGAVSGKAMRMQLPARPVLRKERPLPPASLQPVVARGPTRWNSRLPPRDWDGGGDDRVPAPLGADDGIWGGLGSPAGLGLDDLDGAGPQRRLRRSPAEAPVRLPSGPSRLLPTDGCRWIDGDPKGSHRYCDAPRASGAAWCEEHRARVYARPDKEAG